MMQWETKKLEDLADFYLGKMLDKKKNKGDHRPYLANINVRWGGFELDDLREMRFEDREKERYGLEYGDIVMCEGGEPGRCAIWKNQVPGMMFQKALHRIRPNATLDYRFLYYSFLNRGQEGGFDQYCTGATIKHLPRQNLAKVEVAVPPLKTQQAIASILSTYDDLIENNTRRIEILEEMARRLYEEWFVHFRFPGHEEVSFKESELGEIPEGWEVVQLSEVSEYISRGISPKYAESDCRVINQKCIRDNRLNMALSREQIKKVPEAKYVRFGDVLINSTGVGTLGRVAQVYESLENVTVDSHVTIVRPLPEIDFDFFGIGLQILQPYFEGLGVGATGQTELSRVRVGETPVAIPPAELQKKFGELVGPMRRACIKYGVKNTNLRAQRDLLLPKLVSGEIDVSDIPMPNDKEVEAA